MPGPAKKVKKAGGKKKKNKVSVPAFSGPSPLSLLVSSYESTVPSLLSSFPHRGDLLYLDLHLLSFPSLTLTLLLSSSSTLQSISHAIDDRHGPSSSLHLYRSPSVEDELPLDPQLSLDQLGCTGGTVDEGRRYQLWYDVLSEVRGGVIMKEPTLPPQLDGEVESHEEVSGEERGGGGPVSVTRWMTQREKREMKERELQSLQEGAARVEVAKAQLQSALSIRSPDSDPSSRPQTGLSSDDEVSEQAKTLSMAWS